MRFSPRASDVKHGADLRNVHVHLLWRVGIWGHIPALCLEHSSKGTWASSQWSHPSKYWTNKGRHRQLLFRKLGHQRFIKPQSFNNSQAHCCLGLSKPLLIPFGEISCCYDEKFFWDNYCEQLFSWRQSYEYRIGPRFYLLQRRILTKSLSRTQSI